MLTNQSEIRQPILTLLRFGENATTSASEAVRRGLLDSTGADSGRSWLRNYPSCCWMLIKATPSCVSSLAPACRKPWAWTRFAIPTFLARRGSISRTWAVLTRLPFNVQKMGRCPFSPNELRHSSQAVSTSAACWSITTTQAFLPFPFSTRRRTGGGIEVCNLQRECFAYA